MWVADMGSAALVRVTLQLRAQASSSSHRPLLLNMARRIPTHPPSITVGIDKRRVSPLCMLPRCLWALLMDH